MRTYGGQRYPHHSDIHTNDSATIPGGDRGIALPRDAMTLPPADVRCHHVHRHTIIRRARP